MTLNRIQYVVYGVSGYSWCVYLEVPFAGKNLSALQRPFNKATGTVRITVEWYFKVVKQLCSFVNSKRKLRVREAPIKQVYHDALLLPNFQNCVQPNQIAQYFGFMPLS